MRPVLVEVLGPGQLADRAFPPIARPVLLTEGAALIPHPAGGDTWVQHQPGLQLAWAPLPFGSHALLAFFFGPNASIGAAATVSAAGIRRLATDLASIADQLEAQP